MQIENTGLHNPTDYRGMNLELLNRGERRRRGEGREKEEEDRRGEGTKWKVESRRGQGKRKGEVEGERKRVVESTERACFWQQASGSGLIHCM